MLTKRVIPCLDVKDGRVVKGVNFVSLRDAGDPVELARAYDREGADEVVFLDITATSDNRATTIEMAAHAAAGPAVPSAAGGGLPDFAATRDPPASTRTSLAAMRLLIALVSGTRESVLQPMDFLDFRKCEEYLLSFLTWKP